MDSCFTWVDEPSVSGTTSWVIIENGEFRAFFQDNVEGTVDVRIYSVELDCTLVDYYTL